jgi:small subunit ribosomal protein S13
MAYILRTHIKHKYLLQGLSSIFGIGKILSSEICMRLGLNKNFLLKNLSDEQIFQINQLVEDLKLPIKGDLHILRKQKIGNLTTLKTYRGSRHRQGLPVRGQRTHTNSRTQKRLKTFKRI